MRYLLDTHALLWYVQGTQLPQRVKDIMEKEECFYSIASLWEIAIKQKLGRLDASFSISELADVCSLAGFAQLEIKPDHIERTKSLDFIHRDPFDRLLISQAQTEDLVIITHDSIIPRYRVPTMW